MPLVFRMTTDDDEMVFRLLLPAMWYESAWSDLIAETAKRRVRLRLTVK